MASKLQEANWKRACCQRAIQAAVGCLRLVRSRNTQDLEIRQQVAFIQQELDKLDRMVSVNYKIEKLEMLLAAKRNAQRQTEKMYRHGLMYGTGLPDQLGDL